MILWLHIVSFILKLFHWPYLAEQELEKLQQQYRVMDGERRQYCEESQNVIRKQQYVLR
jgi:hypothetical protein